MNFACAQETAVIFFREARGAGEVTPEEAMDGQIVVEDIREYIEARCKEHFLGSQALEVLSLGDLEEFLRALMRVVIAATLSAWCAIVEEMAVAWARECPGCGCSRKVCWRGEEKMSIALFLGTLLLAKPYLRCKHGCKGGNLSVVRLLTDLSSGDASPGLKLASARLGADESYGKAQRKLADISLGTTVERTKLRRMALEVEADALEFAQERRLQAEDELRRESKQPGADILVLEADGGSVRVGTLRALEPGEPGFGELTPSRGQARKTRETTWRELVTIDVRAPGEAGPRAQDVVVSIASPEGEKSRRMLTTAGRSGLGDQTEVYGLGDMGSGLARAFDEAFFAYEAFWEADWTHTWNYVRAAADILVDVDVDAWKDKMYKAIWQCDESLREEALGEAEAHRDAKKSATFERCPVHALSTYLENNWERMRFAEMEGRDLPIVSARAESQVRDRTKDRFSVAGAWKLENIEGKATLRTILGEDNWDEFTAWYRKKYRDEFREALSYRLEKAVEEKRLSRTAAEQLLDPSVTVADVLTPFPQKEPATCAA